MTLDEAISHAEEVANSKEIEAEFETDYECYFMTDKEREECKECAADHRQLAEWLTELKEAKRLLRLAVEDFERNNCHAAICETCKHNDGCDYDDNFIWRYKDEVFKIIDKE